MQNPQIPNNRIKTNWLAAGACFIAGVLLLIIASIAAADPPQDRQMLGGENTVFDDSAEAFTNPLPLLGEAELADFEEGDALFEQVFVQVTGDDLPNDGLGPIFNATSCEACHAADGRGRPPAYAGEAETGLLLRLALPQRQADGHTYPDPNYGGQFQELALHSATPEGSYRIIYTEVPGSFADGTPYSLRTPSYIFDSLNYGALTGGATISPRVANQMIGLGMLEAIPTETLIALADPHDLDGDGISGHPNVVWDVVNNQPALGRFGWKAGHPSLLQQTAGAYNGDMGITTSIFPVDGCTSIQTDCLVQPAGGEPEIADEHLRLTAFYASTLAVPAQRNADNPQVQQGALIFEQAQCTACHLPDVQTGAHAIQALSYQTIHPYTDLLLHDMGPGLADGQPDFEASGSEWRTPPLWGTGLIETVNGHTLYLHDGRARSLMEAILWHGGEAEAARNTVLQLNQADRDALIAFLRSL